MFFADDVNALCKNVPQSKIQFNILRANISTVRRQKLYQTLGRWLVWKLSAEKSV